MQMKCKSSKQTQIVNVWLFCVLIRNQTINMLFLRCGSGITESGHPMGTFLSKVAKILSLVTNLNCHFVFCLSCAQTSTISCLLTLFCMFVKSALVESRIDLSKNLLFS